MRVSCVLTTRTRSVAAPGRVHAHAAPENGTRSSAPSKASACRAASSSAGWTAKAATSEASASSAVTSAKISSPRRRRCVTALEARAVVEAGLGEAVVEDVDVERLGVLRAATPAPRRARRPRRRARRRRAAAHVAVLCGASARRTRGARPRRAPRRAAAPRRRRRRGGQRRLQGQLLDHRAADVRACGQRELDQGGAGQQHRAADGVVGQPRVGGQREAAGEQPARRLPASGTAAASSGCVRGEPAATSPPVAREPEARCWKAYVGRSTGRAPAVQRRPVDARRPLQVGVRRSARRAPRARGAARAAPGSPRRRRASARARSARVGADLDERVTPGLRSARTPSANRTAPRTCRPSSPAWRSPRRPARR